MGIIIIIGTILGIATAIIGIPWAIDAWVLPKPKLRPWILRFFSKEKQVVLLENESTQTQRQIRYKAFILAAGTSSRWQASVNPAEARSHPELYWKKVNESLALMGFPILKEPPLDMGLHKACAKLHNKAIIEYNLQNLLNTGITDISIIANDLSPAQQEIQHYIQFWNRDNRLKVNQTLVSGISEVTSSVFGGLKNPTDDKYSIISYSDIVYERRLLEKLLEPKDEDITVLVDTGWRNNYPKRRIWHDELNAEIVYGQEGKIRAIGEAIKRYNDIPTWNATNDRVELFEPIFQQNNISEIVGLFKFSPKARITFNKVYAEIINLKPPNINVKEWKPPLVPKIRFKPKPGDIPIQQALFGCFLDYLNRRKTGLKIKLREVEGGWAEIDHWGDVCLAEERILKGELLLDQS